MRTVALRRVVSLWLVLALLWAPAQAAVLMGGPLFPFGHGDWVEPAEPVQVDALGIQGESSRNVVIGANPLQNVPVYEWWYGCSPTSAGMLVGYWDAQPGTGNLADFDASYWWGDTYVSGNPAAGPDGPARMVASYEHIEGTAHADNCLADFMNTTVPGGGTSADDVAPGLTEFFAWDDPTTANNESCSVLTAQAEYVLLEGGTFDYDDFKGEIAAGNPVLLNVSCLTTDGDPTDPQPVMHAHSVVGYGYQDDMYTICNPATGQNVTVPGFAVRDTWDPEGSPSTLQSSWIYESGGGYYFLFPTIDGDGVEWWPFVDETLTQGYYWWNPGETDPAWFVWDWQVFHAVTVTARIPEPGAVVLLGLGLSGLLALGWRKRRSG